MNKAEAAARLSMPEREITEVRDHEHGTVIVTKDGTETLDCTVPDAEGATGLMLLRRPDAKERDDPQASPYAQHVFAPLPPPADGEVEHVDEPTPADDAELERTTEPDAPEPKKTAKK